MSRTAPATELETFSVRSLQVNDSNEPPSRETEVSNRQPDGATRRYQMLLLAAGFSMIFNVIGINQVFGVFQEFYTSSQTPLKDAENQDALVSLVGSIGTGLTWSGGILVNPITSRGTSTQIRLVTLAGVLIMSLGLFLASFCDRLWQLYLTQGLMYGIGSSMYYFPIISTIPLYFGRHRGAALGLVLSGAGFGGLVVAPVLQSLIGRFGAAWALRILGMWNLLVGVPVSFVVCKREGFGSGSRSRVNMSLVKRGTFLYQSAGAFLQAAGNVVPLYYMTSYSTSVLSYSPTTASLFIAINSAINSVSRILMGVLADRVGRQNTMVTGAILSGVSVMALWYDAARPRFISFVVIYGIYAGGYNALLPTTITEIYGDANYTSVNGFIYFIRGLGSMVGAPLAGLILGHYSRTGAVPGESAMALKKRFNDVVVYDSTLLLAAGFCVASVRWLDARDKGRWKWKA